MPWSSTYLTGFEALADTLGGTVSHPDDVDDVRGAHTVLLNGGERVDVNYRCRQKNGSWIFCEAAALAIRDVGGGTEENHDHAARRQCRYRRRRAAPDVGDLLQADQPRDHRGRR